MLLPCDPWPMHWVPLGDTSPCGIACLQCQGCNVVARRIHGLTSISDGRVQEAGGYSLFQIFFLDSLIPCLKGKYI